MKPSPLDLEVDELVKNGGLGELQALRTKLAAEKMKIQGQLTDNRADLMEHRQSYLAQGLSTREAVIRSSSDFAREGDTDWRARAVGALRHLETNLSKLKARIRQLNFADNTQQVTILTGTAEEVAVKLREVIDDGQYILHTVAFQDSLLVFHRIGADKRG
jgi:ElaB/YqjD/DUF883 family membrane-anchored ribosome-binding protein